MIPSDNISQEPRLETVRLAPYDDYYHARCAAIALALGRFDDAIRTYRRASRIKPHNRCYEALLADVYHEAGMPEEAAHYRRRAGELDEYDQAFVARRRDEARRARRAVASAP